jgi:hypothetical protein
VPFLRERHPLHGRLPVMPRVQWEALPQEVRDVVQEQAGAVVKTTPISEGINSDITLIAHTATSGPLFIKGSRSDNEVQLRALGREAAVNPYITAVSPELLWEVQEGGWKLLGFEYVSGRRVDYSPGSPDIPKIVEALTVLGEALFPSDLRLPFLERRMSNYTPARELWRFAGTAVHHTDLNPGNVRISGERAYLVDWAVPTRGVAWSDAASLVLCLITYGHAPDDAERLAGGILSWAAADPEAVDICVRSQESTWVDLCGKSEDVWTKATVAAAQRWAHYRRGLP